MNAVETDYAVSKEAGVFDKEEIEAILQIDGVTISEYGVQTYAKNLVKWDKMDLCAKVQIIEENSFYNFKVTQARTPRLQRFQGTMEEALSGGRILVEPTYQLTRQKEMLAGDMMYIRNFLGEEVPFEIATVGGKKDDGTCDCYVYVDFDTYEMLFGMPELTKFHVMLDGITRKEAENALAELSEGYTIEENGLLADYTERQLKWDEIVLLLEETVISLLISFSFLLCFYSFYFLSGKEEYGMLYAQGASRKMLRRIIMLQAFRMSVWASFVTVAVATGMAYMTKNQAAKTVEGLADTNFLWWMIPIAMALIIVVSMSATWFASKKVDLKAGE